MLTVNVSIVPVVRTEPNVSVSLNSGPNIYLAQFPLVLAFVCIVHKVQGLTPPSIVFFSNLNRQKKFIYGVATLCSIK